MVRPNRQQKREQEHTSEGHIEESEAQSCPECDSQTLVSNADCSEVVCDDCGLVIEEQTMHDKGLTT